MAITSALNIGVQGIQGGMNRLQGHASDIARLNTEPRPGTEPVEVPPQAAQAGAQTPVRPSLEQSMVGQIEAKHLVQSNARTIEVASDTMGTLLDVKA